MDTTEGNGGQYYGEAKKPSGGQPGLPDEAPARKSGAQPGNQNARKHGLYARHMNKKERALFEEAKKIVGNRNEKALLRIKLDAYMAAHPDDLATMARIVKVLDYNG
jgi:hypothetical protein